MGNKKTSLLWQIDHPDLPYSSYLFGTMHLRRNQPLPILDIAFNKLESCDQFFAEIDLSSDTVFPSGKPQNWISMVKSAKLQRISRIIQKTTKLPKWQLAHVSPLLLINLISSRILAPNGQAMHMDQLLWDKASALEKQLGGLETLEEQIAVYNSISIKEQIKSLQKICSNISSYRRTILLMDRQYTAGNISHLYQTTRRSIGSLRKQMIFHRNRKMARRLTPLIHQGPTFAAVGAAHLSGNKGMIKLLKSKGFKLRPIIIRSSVEIA